MDQKSLKAAKREQSDARNAAWRELSPAEQLKRLDRAFGPGQGARRQRARLAKALQAGSSS